MNRLSAQRFFAVFCSVLVCVGSNVAFANENEEVSFPTVVQVENAKNVHVEMKQMDFLQEVISKYAHDEYYLQRIHSDGYYHLVAFSDTGDVVQLHDASKWQVARSGRHQVLYWVQSDEIFIKPCISWFSSNKYVLHNRTINQTVEVSLIAPPLPMGADTFRIVNIEPYERLVLLSDNTVWQMGSDVNFFQLKIGQRVLVGVNNEWRTTAFPHILINVDVTGEPYSKALFYGYPVQY